MNVAEKMREVIVLLIKGIDGIAFPGIKPECEDMWGEDYAIVNGLWHNDPITFCESEFVTFDSDSFRAKVQATVRDHFPGCEVRFMWTSQEIEVERTERIYTYQTEVRDGDRIIHSPGEEVPQVRVRGQWRDKDVVTVHPKKVELSKEDEKAFEDFKDSVRRIRERTERDIQGAIRKFRRAFKNKGMAYTPPELKLTDPKLYRLV
jgi:hypothetical protein